MAVFSFCSTLVTKLNKFLLNPEVWISLPSQLLIFTVVFSTTQPPDNLICYEQPKLTRLQEFMTKSEELCLQDLLTFFPLRQSDLPSARNPHDGSTCLYRIARKLQKSKTEAQFQRLHPLRREQETAPNQDLDDFHRSLEKEGR